MSPTIIIGLFEGTASIWTESAVDCTRRRLETSPAKPLAFRDVRYTVTLLVDGEVAHVTEENHIAVLAFAIHANTANSVFINRRT